MNKCLVTRLSGVVNNTSLFKLGEMRIKVEKVKTPNSATQGFTFSFNKQATLSILGDGYFTDANLTNNLGKEMQVEPNTSTNIYVSNNDITLCISDKYSIVNFSNHGGNSTLATQSDLSNKAIDLEQFKYSKSIEYIDLVKASVVGDLSALSECTLLKSFNVYSTPLTGEISALKKMTALIGIALSNTQVNGDISALKDLVSLQSAKIISSESINGDIESLKKLASLTTLTIGSTNGLITGDIANLGNMSKLSELSLTPIKLTGDLASLPAVCRFISFKESKGASFTWGTRPSSSKIIAIAGVVPISNIDKMLQDQAQCQVGFTSSDATYYKTIAVTGTRTSASDDAVQALQAKGYTVSVYSA